MNLRKLIFTKNHCYTAGKKKNNFDDGGTVTWETI